MSLEIKVKALQPKRHTYANVAKRLGEDRPATRYQEATFDMQPTHNFHYRPLWDPERELYDVSRTKIVMEDWYAFQDPRQFYYATYTISRNKLMDVCDNNFKFIEKHGLLEGVAPEWLETLKIVLLPLRHYEWGANMTNMDICHLGYGAAVTQAAGFCAMDRLGIAQILSRIGLLFDGNTGDSLHETRACWTENEIWQGVRHIIEDSFVLDDWFEKFVVQNIVLDGLVYPLAYEHLDQEGKKHGATAVTMATEFMRDWFKDHNRWCDALLKVVAAESAENKDRLETWISAWLPRACEALAPVANTICEDGPGTVSEIAQNLTSRLKKAGLEINQGQE